MRRMIAILFILMILSLTALMWWYSLQLRDVVQRLYSGEPDAPAFIYPLLYFPNAFAVIIPLATLILLVIWILFTLNSAFMRRLVIRMIAVTVVWGILMLAYISNPSGEPRKDHLATVQVGGIVYHLGGLYDLFGDRYTLYACDRFGVNCEDVYNFQADNPNIRLLASPDTGVLVLEIDGAAVFSIRSV